WVDCSRHRGPCGARRGCNGTPPRRGWRADRQRVRSVVPDLVSRLAAPGRRRRRPAIMNRIPLETQAAVPAGLKVLLVDTLSSSNDYGVDLVRALAPLVRLTVFTVKGTHLGERDCARLLPLFPEYWGRRSRLGKFFDEVLATLHLAVELWRHRR